MTKLLGAAVLYRPNERLEEQEIGVIVGVDADFTNLILHTRHGYITRRMTVIMPISGPVIHFDRCPELRANFPEFLRDYRNSEIQMIFARLVQLNTPGPLHDQLQVAIRQLVREERITDYAKDGMSEEHFQRFESEERGPDPRS